MKTFFRFPHTPHIGWLGSEAPRGDKILSCNQLDELLSGCVIVEEKVDGANLGIFINQSGDICVQNRGGYLAAPFGGQFSRLPSWIMTHSDALTSILERRIIIFGEWCAAKHTLRYDNLPDWFLIFDVFDRVEKRFWSSSRRDALAASAGLSVVSSLYRGKGEMVQLSTLLENSKSSYREGSLEGIVIRKDSDGWLDSRAKLVRADFTQNIGEHWRSREIEWNKLRTSS